MPLRCPSPKILVPAHCRNPSSKKRKKKDKEVERIKEVIEDTRQRLKKVVIEVPKFEEMKLVQSPHKIISGLTKHYAHALFDLPHFVPWAHSRMISKKYIVKFPDFQDRYAYLEKKFLNEKGFKKIPISYKLAVMETVISTIAQRPPAV